MSPFDRSNHGEYFIIESPTRGVFREWDHDEDKPRFSSGGLRSDPEKALRFLSIELANEMLAKFPEKLRKQCKILDASWSFDPVGTTEHKYMVHGYWYGGPDEDGVDKEGYLHFYDIIITTSPDKAKAMAAEDYGDYNTIEVVGIARDNAQEGHWLKKNDELDKQVK